MKFFIVLSAIIVACYVGYGVFLYVVQRSLIYFPTPEVDHRFTEAVFDTGEAIRVIIVNPGHDHAVMYFGGNAEMLAVTADEFEAMLPDITAYLVHYRGYGGSTGKPTERGLYHDALAIHDAIRNRHETLAVMGRSLGAAVATKLASQRDIDKLVLVTPFGSAVHVARDLFPIYPASMLVRDRFDSLGRVDTIEAPTLLLIAGDDTIIPPRHGHELGTALDQGIVTTEVLSGTGHNDISLDPAYWPRIRRFLAPAQH